MKKQSENNASLLPTLADVDAAVERRTDIPSLRRRDYRSGVAGVSKMLGESPGQIPLDMGAISIRLNRVSPASAGISTKTFANVRSSFMGAVRVSGLLPSAASAAARADLLPTWSGLLAKLPHRRQEAAMPVSW